jgi:hypothetical protein
MEDKFILNAQGQTDHVGGAAKSVDLTRPHKAAIDFGFLRDVTLISTPVHKVNTVGKFLDPWA